MLAAACLAPLALRLPWRALAGLAATAAYPLGAGVVTLALGGRNPDEYTNAELAPAFLAHHALGTGWYGAIALFAVLAAAVAIPRRPAARMFAATVLVVGVLYTQGVPEIIFHATGLGRVLWRMLWLIPVAAAIGALAVRWSPRRAAIGALPAVAVCVLIAIVGAPIWSSAAFGRLDGHPALKLNAGDEAAARAILRRVPRGAHVLAPQSTSQALLVLSGTVTVVNPLSRYTKSLDQFGPRARATARVTLGNFAETGVNSLRHANAGSLRAEVAAPAVRAHGVPAARARAERRAAGPCRLEADAGRPRARLPPGATGRLARSPFPRRTLPVSRCARSRGRASAPPTAGRRRPCGSRAPSRRPRRRSGRAAPRRP